MFRIAFAALVMLLENRRQKKQEHKQKKKYANIMHHAALPGFEGDRLFHPTPLTNKHLRCKSENYHPKQLILHT